MNGQAYRYKWSKRFSVSPQVFGEFYYSLKRRTPEELLRAATKKKSPIHKLFNWDNTSAAHEYRLLQARIMVSSLQVEIVNAKGKPTHVTAFIRSVDQTRHVATMEASSEEISGAMQDCWRDMLSFRAKYKNLEVASQVIQAIDDVDRRFRRMRKAA